MSLTLYEKLVRQHTVTQLDDEHVLLYVDFHIMNEYTSPQAFAGLHTADRPVWRPQAHLAVVDHVNPTRPIQSLNDIEDEGGRLQIETLSKNCIRHNIQLFDLFDPRQGIEHIVVPENGFAWPGMVIACGDSHTTTYGAFGALGFGIGTSEIEHVLATQTLVYKTLKPMLVQVDGILPIGVTAKDVVMAFVAKVGAAGASGFAVEFAGSTIAALSVEARMTICNMAVEAGARAAVIAPDQKVFDYLDGRPHAPKGADMVAALGNWQTLQSEPGAQFDKVVHLDATMIEPLVTWGTSPDQSVPVTRTIPNPTNDADHRALDYMGLFAGQSLSGLKIDRAFIGSCTNARIEDLRKAAKILKGHQVCSDVTAIVVPGSKDVRRVAEAEGLDAIFRQAGFEWRGSGCSMCLAMNDDIAMAGERCASSTNRNFEGRQGRGVRTHLMSPEMVAAAAVNGAIVDVRKMMETHQ
ncbi:3-isopropylmalate dehydratase large subunit [Parasulfitobacter algicola]|nr:3-isopropylmalate dehydratase large subunit [Sulfitobacter algicola]